MYAGPTNRLLKGQKSRLAAFNDGSHGQYKKPMCHGVETVEVRQIAAACTGSPATVSNNHDGSSCAEG
jgi:hypothetical protein